MPDPRWQDHLLSDIIDTQLLLLVYLSRVVEGVGPLRHDTSAAALRRIAAQNVLRPGVKSCLRAIAREVELCEVSVAPSNWVPKVIPGGGPERDAGAGDEKRGATTGREAKGRRGTGRRDNGRAGNGHAANGDLPAGWRPTIVGEDDSDSGPDCA